MSLPLVHSEARSAYDSPEVSHRASRTARIQRNQLKAFTLIELLVVIAIIASSRDAVAALAKPN